MGMLVGIALLGACAPRGAGRGPSPGRVRPGIEVLLDDSVHLIRGKRVGLLTNHTGVDRRGTSDIDLLASDARAKKARVTLVSLFAPEHGIRGTEDRTNLASGTDERTGLPIHSLYTRVTIGPPDSTLRGLDVLLFDLQDIGTRTWTYVGNLVYALRAVKRNGIPLVVLDRPAPITGDRRDGPMLDRSLANAEDHTPARQGRAYALYPFPLRHGMTMGELARFYNETLGIGADLRVVPMKGWRRDMWFDETGLAWVRPSPNLPSLTSALLYPALVGFEGSNLSVGRGTPEAFQQLGAPWLDAPGTVKLLADRAIPGVRFEAVHFTPVNPGDAKFSGRRIPGVRVVVVDRERIHVGRVGAALLWAISRTSRDSLRVSSPNFDRLFGDPAARVALMRGEDPDSVIDRSLPEVVAFDRNARRFLIYR